jgi:hypothetical protein
MPSIRQPVLVLATPHSPGMVRRPAMPRAVRQLADDRFARWTLLVACLLITMGVGGLAALRPRTTLAVCSALAVIALVSVRPALGGYVIVALTPLTAGIDRGQAVPILRPSEALALSVGVALVARALLRWRTGGLPRWQPSQLEWALILMAVCNSVVPILWMTAQYRPVSRDDLLYALVLWKYAGYYLIIRSAITTNRQVLRCLWLSVGAGAIVGLLAILQSLHLFGVPTLLATYYAPFGYTGALEHARGSSTLALPAATADLMIYNLAIVSGLLWRGRRHRLILASAAALFAIAAFSAGEFSSAIGLIVGVCTIALVTSYPRLLALFVPLAGVAIIVLRPVIAARISGFDSVSGLPVSWTGRLSNLHNYFWPRLFSDWNFVFGVQPAARVPVSYQATGYVWIESGYTWLLWGGGIPLAVAFVFFVQAALRMAWRLARYSVQPPSVAALAVFVSVIVMSVLMIFDPHLTYRGAAEEMFVLLALAAVHEHQKGRTGGADNDDAAAKRTEALR